MSRGPGYGGRDPEPPRELPIVSARRSNGERDQASTRRTKSARSGRRFQASSRTLDPLYALSAGVGDPAGRLAALRAYPRPSLCRWATTPALARAVDAVGATHFDSVVVLRSYLAPYAAPFLPAGSFRVLDLDDDERLTQSRLSELHERRGRTDAALLAGAEADKYAAHERAWLPRFDLALAASELHAAAVRVRDGGVAVRTMPNTVEVPEAPRGSRSATASISCWPTTRKGSRRRAGASRTIPLWPAASPPARSSWCASAIHVRRGCGASGRY